MDDMATRQVRISEEAEICELIRKVCVEGVKQSENKEIGKKREIDALFNSNLKENQKHIPWVKVNSSFVLKDILTQINKLMIDKKKKTELEGCLQELQSARCELLDSVKGGGPFPSRHQATRYLTTYRNVLIVIFSMSDVLADCMETQRAFLQDILNIDIYFGDNKGFASIYSPIAIEAILKIYDYIEEYIGIVLGWHEKHEKNGRAYAILESNYQAVIISKALRLFRWICVHENDLYQAALPAALPLEEKDDTEQSLDIPVRRLEDYSSYEGIGELRLFDKIIYEIERRKEEETQHHRVLVIGDILKTPMETLCRAVDCWIERKKETCEKWKDKDIRIQLAVYTRNHWREESSGKPKAKFNHVEYIKYDYNGELTDSSKIDEFVENYDWMFLLDVCDLYNEMWIELQDESTTTQMLSRGKDFDIAELQQPLYSIAFAGFCGRLKKEINQTFFKYLGEKLKSYRTKRKTAYIYISDRNAISKLDYTDEYFIRLEQYNEKEILIIRMPEMDEMALPEYSEKIIVLNLWQVIKHGVVRNIDCFLGYFGLQDIESAIGIFRDTLIGVQYDEWPDKLHFSYCVPEDIGISGYKEKVEEWIEVGIMPYFQTQKGNIFNEYFLKSYGSFLYSDAKSVDDMLFLHLFRNKHHLLKETVLEGENKNLSEYQSKRCKYSQKQFYATVMEDYDTSSEMFAYKYMKLELMEKADSSLRKGIFEKVLSACRRNKYEDSYLAINCLKMM